MTRLIYKSISAKLVTLHKALSFWDHHADDEIYNLLDVTNTAL